MYHIKRLVLDENVFNVKNLDYIDSFTELFEIFSYLVKKSYIDKNGSLMRSLDDINDEIEKIFDLDEWFGSIEEYYSQLEMIINIIKLNRNKL